MRRVPQKPVLSTEYLFRTVEACFLHRMLLKTRRVPEEAFLSTARIFGTVGGRFRYRVPSKGQGKGPPQRSLAHRGRLPPQRSGLTCLGRDNQVINLIEVRSFRSASETHRTWLSGAQERGWQLPLGGLSTPRRSKGRVRRSCRLIFLLYLRKNQS